MHLLVSMIIATGIILGTIAGVLSVLTELLAMSEGGAAHERSSGHSRSKRAPGPDRGVNVGRE